MVAIQPGVLLVGLVIVLSPLFVALRIEGRARRFQKEAFGHLAKAALALRQATWGVMVFYVLVIVGSFATGQYDGIFDWPLSQAHVFVYIRILAVTVAYLLFGRVAEYLYLVTVPGGQKARTEA